MRKLPLLLLFLALPAAAQEIQVTTPATQAKLKVDSFLVFRNPATAKIGFVYQDAGNNDVSNFGEVTIPSAACGSATVAGLISAMMTVRATETGTDVRKMNFRVGGYVKDNDCGLPAGTLVP